MTYAIGSLVLAAVFAATAVLASIIWQPVYAALSAPGLLVVSLWLGWQLAKLAKFTSDRLHGTVDPSDKCVLITGE